MRLGGWVPGRELGSGATCACSLLVTLVGALRLPVDAALGGPRSTWGITTSTLSPGGGNSRTGMAGMNLERERLVEAAFPPP